MYLQLLDLHSQLCQMISKVESREILETTLNA